MRIHGTLIRWNDERGFGFIETAAGSEELFVHISAFPRGARPQTGELVSFEIEVRLDGKKRAIRVMRAGSTGTSARSPHPRTTRSTAPRRPVARIARLAIACALVAMGVYAYRARMEHRAASLERMPTVVDPTPVAAPLVRRAAAASAPTIHATASQPALPWRAAALDPVTSFTCGGRTMCSQMTSCSEATWVLNHCPGTKMDGNHDGVPCEQQWCGG